MRAVVVALPLVGLTLACGGIQMPVGSPVGPAVYGVDLAGLRTVSTERGVRLPGARVDRVTDLLERSGWRSWRPSYDESVNERLHSRWSRVDEAGELWLDLVDDSDDVGEAWLLVALDPAPAIRSVDLSSSAPRRLEGRVTQRLVAAASCTADELGRTIDVDFEADRSFTWTASNGMDYSGGRWELRGDDLRLRGKLATTSGSRRPHTTVCRDAALMGQDDEVEMLVCHYGFTFFCGRDPGPVVYVMDGGAGSDAVELVTHVLRGPTVSGPRTWAYRWADAEESRTDVRVFHRGDPEQAERIAYRLHRDLQLDGISIEAWPKAPMFFAVVVGGAVEPR